MGLAHILKTAQYSDDVVVVDPEALNNMQNKLLNMLKDVISACDKSGVKWFLSGGSVLGAVRHKGFIPWDDDIDIFMERMDYEKFKKNFSFLLGDKYTLKVPGDKNYVLNLPQIQKKGTFVKPIQSTESSNDGLFIDIFILENTYNNIFLRSLHGMISTSFLFIDSALRMEACKKNILKSVDGDLLVGREVQKRARFAPLFHFWPFEKWLTSSDIFFSRAKKRGKYLVCPSGAKHFFGELYPSSLFDKPKKMLFEHEIVNVPNPPDNYLRSRFGENYMILPDESERERHAYIEIDLGEE